MPVPSHVQTEDKAFIRDTHSKGLLCTDRAALDNHRRKQAQNNSRVRQTQQIANLEQRVNELTDMVRTLCQTLAARTA